MKQQYIKDGKIYDLPIYITTTNNTVIITNDENKILEAGYEKYVYTPQVKTMQELIEDSDIQINKETDNKILNEFTFAGEQFYLTVENQTNFANMFIAKDYLTFPQRVKTKTGFYEIKDKTECESFYLSGVAFVKFCLEEGWQKKTAATKMIQETF